VGLAFSSRAVPFPKNGPCVLFCLDPPKRFFATTIFPFAPGFFSGAQVFPNPRDVINSLAIGFTVDYPIIY